MQKNKENIFEIFICLEKINKSQKCEICKKIWKIKEMGQGGANNRMGGVKSRRPKAPGPLSLRHCPPET